MKRTCNPWDPRLAAALCLALAGGGAASRADETPAPVCQDHKSHWESQEARSPTVYNKASGLIGIRVENEKGERLGRIKDVVIDCHTERVSYVVLEVRSGFLGLNRKLLAAPFSAFRPGETETRLVMHAERRNLELAEGFPKAHWPSPTAPSWGAAPPWEGGSEAIPPKATEEEHLKSRETEEEELGPYAPGSLGWPGW